MSNKKPFALRISEDILKAMQQWADDDIRSLNAQIEYILRQALIKAGRVKKSKVNVVEENSEAER